MEIFGLNLSIFQQVLNALVFGMITGVIIGIFMKIMKGIL